MASTETNQSGGAKASGSGVENVKETAAKVRADVEDAVGRAKDLGADLRGRWESLVADRPLTAVAAAAGVGFVVAGGLFARPTRKLLGKAFGLAVRTALLPLVAGQLQRAVGSLAGGAGGPDEAADAHDEPAGSYGYPASGTTT